MEISTLVVDCNTLPFLSLPCRSIYFLFRGRDLQNMYHTHTGYNRLSLGFSSVQFTVHCSMMIRRNGNYFCSTEFDTTASVRLAVYYSDGITNAQINVLYIVKTQYNTHNTQMDGEQLFMNRIYLFYFIFFSFYL